MIKTLRIWAGEKAIGVLLVDDESGAMTTVTGAGLSIGETIDVEIDPWNRIVTDNDLSRTWVPR